MAYPISSQRTLSLLVQQTFKQCAVSRANAQKQRFSNSAKCSHPKQQAAATTSAATPSSVSSASEDPFIPFSSELPTSTNPATQTSAGKAPSSAWSSQLGTSGYVSQIEIILPDTPPNNHKTTPTLSQNQLPKAARDVSNKASQSLKRTGTNNSDKPKQERTTSNKPEEADEEYSKKPREDWQVQKEALKKKFKEEAWNPKKKLSPDALEGIRALHTQYPDHFTTPVLADHFKISPEAVRRILKSKWKPNPEEEEERIKRWERRGERIWADLVQKKAMHPPKKWRDKGIGQGIPRASSGQLRREWINKGHVENKPAI